MHFNRFRTEARALAREYRVGWVHVSVTFRFARGSIMNRKDDSETMEFSIFDGTAHEHFNGDTPEQSLDLWRAHLCKPSVDEVCESLGEIEPIPVKEETV